MSAAWSGWLWDGATHVYTAILDHPFLTGLSDGTLPPARFAHYLAQDMHYLGDYARALAVVAARAPTHADCALLASHAAQTAEVEIALHAHLLPELGVSGDELSASPKSPTTQAYMSYLLATAYGGSFADGLAAVLPCYWIYQRVGVHLVAQGSPDPRYQRWIDTYAGDEFAATVAEVLALADRIGADLPEPQALRAREHFLVTARYEWMFWDAAWRLESWPV